MQDRFKFNAIVSSYYDIDTPDNYEELEPTFYLWNVDVFVTGEIGIDYDVLFDTVKNQSKDLTDKEIGQIMQHFEDNSNSPECDYVTIKPDKIMQCTGLKDKNGKLIYEGDIVKIIKIGYTSCIQKIMIVKWYQNQSSFRLFDIEALGATPQKLIEKRAMGAINAMEVIGNIYENADLLKEGKE